MPLKHWVVKLFFISRGSNISAGERRGKLKRMKKMKAEGVSDYMLLLPVSFGANADQFLESYYKHVMCQQLPTNSSGTLGEGFWFCLGWHNYSNCGASGASENPEGRRKLMQTSQLNQKKNSYCNKSSLDKHTDAAV